MPVCFLIHERKFQACHDHLFATCCKLISSLHKCKKRIVTDEEHVFVNTVKSYLPSAPHLRCWNHIMQDTLRWLRGHGAPSQDVSIYLSDVQELFHLPSEKEYVERFSEISSKWSAPFWQYYLQNIHPDISSIARWAIAPLGIYNPYSGVTNNQAEGLNYVLKELQEWREVPIDCMVLSFHYLQCFYMIEIARGKQNLGNYHLHPLFSKIAEAQPPLILEPNTYIPEEIVKRIRGKLANDQERASTDEKRV